MACNLLSYTPFLISAYKWLYNKKRKHNMNKNTKLSPNIPAGYPLCLHADCPKAKTCLRQLAFCRCDEMGTYLNLINPALCTKEETCPHYAGSQPVRFAKGFTNFQKRMYPQQYAKFMTLLICHFGRNQ